MIRLTWRTELPQWLMLGGMFLLAALTWPQAPERIPVHWNLESQVDRYGGKVEGLLGLPLVALGVYVLLAVLPRLDPGRANYPRFAGAYTAIRLSLVTLLALLYGVIHLWIRGRQVDVAAVVPLLVGGLLVVLGSVLGRIRPNWFVGIRTPWTLSSQTAWVRTHRVGGWVFIAMGLALIATGVLRSAWAAGAVLVLIPAGVAALVVYSYLAWRDAADKVPPAGARPEGDA